MTGQYGWHNSGAMRHVAALRRLRKPGEDGIGLLVSHPNAVDIGHGGEREVETQSGHL